MEYQLGRKKVNPAFVKSSIGAGISGLLAFGFLAAALSPKRQRSSRRYSFEDRQRHRKQSAASALAYSRYKKPRIQLGAQFEEHLVGFDTNVLLDDPGILADVAQTNKIIISSQVLQELDRKKQDPELGASARKAFYHLDELQADNRLSVVGISGKEQLDVNLDLRQPDHKIIAAYLSEQLRQKRSVLFVSNDRGAKIFARQAGLDVYNGA